MRKISKTTKKLLKKIKRMNAGEDMMLNGFDVLCVEKECYILIHHSKGIFEKTFEEITDWVLNDDDV